MKTCIYSGKYLIAVAILIISAIFLTGCQLSSDQEKPKIEAYTDKIVIDLNSDVDYGEFIARVEDNRDGNLKDKLEHTDIDTSQKGKQTIIYSISDKAGNKSEIKVDVYVVGLFSDGSFDPRDIEAKEVENPEDIDVLINKFYSLPSSYEPKDLEPIIDRKDISLRKEANEAYTAFYNEAKKRGISIYTISAYRSYSYQQGLWNNSIATDGGEKTSRLVAYPGRSEHQLGLVVDISNINAGDVLSERVGQSQLGKFIEDEAYKYGFVLRYPKNKVNITRYAYEPWHIRYVGKDLAKKLHDEKMTLDEYHEKNQK